MEEAAELGNCLPPFFETKSEQEWMDCLLVGHCTAVLILATTPAVREAADPPIPGKRHIFRWEGSAPPIRDIGEEAKMRTAGH